MMTTRSQDTILGSGAPLDAWVEYETHDLSTRVTNEMFARCAAQAGFFARAAAMAGADGAWARVRYGRCGLQLALVCTPGFPLVVAGVDSPEPALLEELLEVLRTGSGSSRGILGPAPLMRALNQLHSETTGAPLRMVFEHWQLCLGHRPTIVASHARVRRAVIADVATISAWCHAFMHEVGLTAIDPPLAEDFALRRIETGSFWVLEHKGQVRAMAGRGPRVGVHDWIGFVYTDPQFRGCQHAAALVANMCSQDLGPDQQGFLLFTDASNPHANRLYESVGFRRCGAWTRMAIP